MVWALKSIHSMYRTTHKSSTNLLLIFNEMVKTPALYTKGRRFEPHRRRFFTPTVVLLSFNKSEKVLWTIAKYYYYV